MRFKLINSQLGFCTVQSFLFIGLFATLTLCFGFLGFIAQAKMQFRSTCLHESIEIQRQIILFEKKLFALNPLSTSLQLDYDITIAASEVAEIAVPVAIALKAKAALIRAEQIQLDVVQNGLIKVAEAMVALQTSKLEMKMLHDSSKLSGAWTFFLRSIIQISASTWLK